MARQRRRSLCLLITVWFLSGSVHVVRAQNRTGATTDPDEGVSQSSFFFQNNRRSLVGLFCTGWLVLKIKKWFD